MTPSKSVELEAAVERLPALILEDAEALERFAEEADDNNWQDWGATMRQAAQRIRSLVSASNARALAAEEALREARPFVAHWEWKTEVQQLVLSRIDALLARTTLASMKEKG